MSYKLMQGVLRVIRVLIAIVSLILVLSIVDRTFGQRVSSEERQAIKEIRELIDAAGKSFKAKKLPESGKSLTGAKEKLMQLAQGARPELIKALKTEYGRLAKAHGLLIQAGQELPELPSLDEAVDPSKVSVSFEKEVAPIIVAKCGNCHVSRNRGRFSAATFDALEKSTTIAFGIPKDSRLIQVIETGEMPKGGLKVSPDELETLKTWISQGAKFDGKDRNQNLNQIANPGQPTMAPGLEVAKPTGKETVSFGLNVAPILIENCARCHMGNNPQGNFLQATFESLLRGGDSGAPIKPGDSEGSFLYRRIVAGEMPPNGKLPQESIAVIKKWIDEGAKFDGLDSTTTLVSIAKTAKAGSQSHVELLKDRTRLSLSHWELVMDKGAPIQVASKNFTVFSSSDELRTKAISAMLEKMIPKLASYFKADGKLPLVKGNTSVFVFDKRYDFSEFGKMVSRQDLSKEQTCFWNFTVTDAFASILLTQNQTAEDAEVQLVQQVSAVYMASLSPDIPRWFSDGTGYWAATRHDSKSELVKSWEAASEAVVRSIKTPADLLEGRLSVQEAGLAGYQVIKALKKKSSTFDRMLTGMRSGESFAKAFEDAYGTPLEIYLTRGW